MTDPMDDRIRRVARAARAEVEAAVNPTAALTDLPRSSTPTSTSGSAGAAGRRGLAVLGAAAAFVVAVGGGALLIDRSESIETATPVETEATVASVAVAPVTTAPQPTTTAVQISGSASSTVPGDTTTSTTAPTDSDVVVSHADPPPPLSLRPIGAATAPEPRDGSYSVAIGDRGVAVNSWSYSGNGPSRLDVFDDDGGVRTLEITSADGALLAYGPGDIAYFTDGSFPEGDFSVTAVPLSGPNADTVVASRSANINRYLEYPVSSFGHAATGVLMRRDEGATAIDYVDADGEPVTLADAPPWYAPDDELRFEGTAGTIRASDGTTWSIDMDVHPDRAGTYAGDAPPAPTTGDDAVFWSHIGPNLDPTIDFGEPSGWVIAQLHPDGTVTWWSVPDGWLVVASDVWGTVLARQTGTDLVLALAEFVPTIPKRTIIGDTRWQDLRWESTRYARTCDGTVCTQTQVGPDGSTVTFDPIAQTLTRHSTPPITATLPADVQGRYLTHVGPDGVVYLITEPQVPSELAADFVAITLADDGAGRVVGRWDDAINLSGDNELVNTREGLVNVECCGPNTIRPATDAEVMVPWVSRNGDTAEWVWPTIQVEIEYPSMTINRRNRLPVGTVSWTVELGDDWEPHGMPLAMPTFDGGVILATYGAAGTTVTRTWVGGVVESILLTDVFEITLDPSGRFVVPDRERFARVDPFPGRTWIWAERPEVDFDTGEVQLPGIDELADANDWGVDPIAYADVVAGPPLPNERRVIELTRADNDTFVAKPESSNLFDDSGFAVRFDLTLVRDELGRFQLAKGSWASVCQPGRGHQDFAVGRCT